MRGTIWSSTSVRRADTLKHIVSRAMPSSSVATFSRKWAVLTLRLGVAIMRTSILAAALITAVGGLASILTQAFNTREADLLDADAPSESWCGATAAFTFRATPTHAVMYCFFPATGP